MKRLFSWLLILVYLAGCSSATLQSSNPYVSSLTQVNKPPDTEAIAKYTGDMCNKLDSCIASNDPLIDYWDKMVLLPLEPYTSFNDEWMSYLDQKAKEYKETVLPECRKIILEGFEQIGVQPKENDYRLLRAEFILACLGDPSREIVRAAAFNKLTDRVDAFFRPIYQKAKSEAQTNQRELDAILNQENKDLSFWKVYMVLYNHAIQEKAKVMLRGSLDRKYSPVLQSKLTKWVNDLQPSQKKTFSNLLSQAKSDKSTIYKFLKSLNPNQYATIEMVSFKIAFIEQEKAQGKERLDKLSRLMEWLNANEEKAEASKTQEQYIKAARAQAIGTLLMGFASCLTAYTAWRQAYYDSYRAKNFEIYDNFGREIHGTIW
jgi:hypothetical protein